MSESRFRLYQYQTNVLVNFDLWRCHAGDWVIQRLDDTGYWRNFDGPYAPHEKSTAERRLKQFQDAELPQIFDDMETT